jgi:hypothetical protein
MYIPFGLWWCDSEDTQISKVNIATALVKWLEED